MTLAGDGSGTLAYRVVIDGCPIEAVTHIDMVRAGSTNVAERVDGLNIQDTSFDVQISPMAADVRVGGLSIKFVDIENRWSELFNREPPNTTWLTQNCDDSDTTITVASTAGFASSGYIWIDSECVHYASKSGTEFTSCTRGALSADVDAATYHYISDGERLRSPEITDWPVLFEGRRVRVYRYDETQSLQGDGTQCFLGMISTSPMLDDVTWSIGVDGITSILGQSLGADLSTESFPRGIYYPLDAPLNFVIRTNSTVAEVQLAGFFETQEAFVEELNVKIAAAQLAASQTNLIYAIADGSDCWHMIVKTDAGAGFDFAFIGYPSRTTPVSPIDPHFGFEDGGPQLEDGQRVAAVSAGVTYYYWPSPYWFPDTPGIAPHMEERTGIPGAGSVPRGIFNVRLTEEARTIYMGGATAISSLIDSVQVEWPEDGVNEASTDTYAFTSYDGSARSILVQNAEFTEGGSVGVVRRAAPTRYFTSQSLPTIRFGLLLSSTGGGSTFDLMNTITNYQAQYSPLGVVPQLRAGDWNFGDWYLNAVVGQPQLATRRLYTTFEPVELRVFLREDLKFAGCTLAVDTSGRIVPKRIRLAVQTESAQPTEIDQTTLLTDRFFVKREACGLGMINTITVRTGYDAQEQKWNGTVTIRDVAAFGRSSVPKALMIESRSTYVGSEPITPDTLVSVAAGYFGAFGGSYAIDTLDVAKGVNLEVGEPIVFSNPHTPDATGALGLTTTGLLLGTKSDAYSPRTTITVLTTLQKIGGYAPAFDIPTADDLGGDLWEMYSIPQDTLPPGTTIDDFLAVGDRVRIVELNTLTAGVVVGTVTSVSPDDIFVQFDGAWGGPASGTGWWYLTFANSNDANLADGQKRFTYIANADGAIEYSGSTEPAWRFGA